MLRGGGFARVSSIVVFFSTAEIAISDGGTFENLSDERVSSQSQRKTKQDLRGCACRFPAKISEICFLETARVGNGKENSFFLKLLVGEECS